MTKKLFRNISHLVTMNLHREERKNVNLYVTDGIIETITPASNEILHPVDEDNNLSGHIVLPGLINTHHHFYQTLTRAFPGAQNANLFKWLKTLYPIWGKLTPEAIFISTQTALAELALSGCTTSSDHLYIFPNGVRLDDEIAGAKEIGMRLHASRGSMSLGESKGGLPPDNIVENEENILNDTVRVIEKYHDPSPGSTLQIVIAPCSPFSVTTHLMKVSADLARHYNVKLHTHLAETHDEELYCLEKFGYRPVDFMQEMGWINPEAWFAHSIFLNNYEIATFARERCGIAHCPSSNMRLSSGIAPIRKLAQAGVKIGLGVDGSASNDCSHMINEIRQAMFLSRIESSLSQKEPEISLSGEDTLMSARQAFELATLGGAAVLGRNDIGSLEPGKCADFFGVRLDQIIFAGAMHDPLAALVFCGPAQADLTVVGGEYIVKDSVLQTVDLGSLISKHNNLAKRLID